MFIFFKKQRKGTKSRSAYKEYSDKLLHRGADYLNRRTTSWNKKSKTVFLVMVCCLFTFSTVLLFLKTPKPVVNNIIGSRTIKLSFPEPKPPGKTTTVPTDSLHSKKKPP